MKNPINRSLHTLGRPPSARYSRGSVRSVRSVRSVKSVMSVTICLKSEELGKLLVFHETITKIAMASSTVNLPKFLAEWIAIVVRSTAMAETWLFQMSSCDIGAHIDLVEISTSQSQECAMRLRQ